MHSDQHAFSALALPAFADAVSGVDDDAHSLARFITLVPNYTWPASFYGLYVRSGRNGTKGRSHSA